MPTNRHEAERLDVIVKKMIDTIEKSKKELYDVAENARKDCSELEEELSQLKLQAKESIESIELTEHMLLECKKKLLYVNRNFSMFSQEELKKTYEQADILRIELDTKREQEKELLKKRNELEVRIKDYIKTVEKAESLMSQVGIALGYLTGEMVDISTQLEDIQSRQLLGFRIIKAQEEERQRVAREIHDGPAQTMSSVVMKAEICEKLIDMDLFRAKDELQLLKKVARESMRDVRKIIYNLRPMSLDDLGLIPTLQRYILTLQEDTGIRISFKTKGVYDDIRPVISLTVFRILQEAMNNIIKHSKAQNVAVNLEFPENGIKLHVYDDGVGFSLEEIKKKKADMNGGFGLLSMRERVELLNGKLQINSRPGNGTRLDITIPLNTKEGV